MPFSFARLLRRLRFDRRGSIVPTFALVVVPIVGLVGAAVDYSRAANDRAVLQRAVDAAVLAGANDGTESWLPVSQGTFTSTYTPKDGSTATAQFAVGSNRYTGSATATVATSLLTPLGYRSIQIGASATAYVSDPESEISCFLSFGKGLTSGTESMTFSGSPNVTLTGCALRSNTSMKCNGHDTGATASVSAGATTNCSNPVSGARVVSDIYKGIATNITRKCSGTSQNITWRPGSPPNSSKMVTVYLADRTEYHVCGDLTLSGSGSLTGASPATDTIIVIENGSLSMASNAAISASRTAIVLTGNNTVSSTIDFPNGNGQSASLTLTPPTNDTDPWAGIAIYQDPALTYRVDSSWGPGATFSVDGIVYLPNANLSLGGNASSASIGCTKYVANTITMGGAVDVRQSTAACTTAHVTQWSIPRAVVLTQ